MSHSPDPQQTGSGPAYEGRLLSRPPDEVVDQGAAFYARTLFSRRRMLSVMGLGADTLSLAACGAEHR